MGHVTKELAARSMNVEIRLGRRDPAMNLVDFGYAPGGYLTTCRDENCELPAVTLGTWFLPKRQFIGDKRAWRCFECALRAKHGHDQKKVEEQRKGIRCEQVRAPQLTRDNLKARNDEEECRTIGKAETIMGLLFKMHDEISEISRDLTNPEEYGDLLEALFSLAKLNGVSADSIREAADRKRIRKGGLVAGNFWVPVQFMETKNA